MKAKVFTANMREGKRLAALRDVHEVEVGPPLCDHITTLHVPKVENLHHVVALARKSREPIKLTTHRLGAEASKPKDRKLTRSEKVRHELFIRSRMTPEARAAREEFIPLRDLRLGL